MSNFYKILRDERTLRTMYQKDMADLAGITLRAYQLYEQGKTEPKIDVLIKFADALDVSLDYLVGRDVYRKRPAPLTGVEESQTDPPTYPSE